MLVYSITYRISFNYIFKVCPISDSHYSIINTAYSLAVSCKKYVVHTTRDEWVQCG